jgi:hypothetical protein
MDVPTTGAVEPLRLFQFESRRKSVVCDVPIVGGFRVGRWVVADRFEGWPVVEPFDRVSRGPFDVVVTRPAPPAMDGLGHSVVAAAVDAADRRELTVSLGEWLGIANSWYCES